MSDLSQSVQNKEQPVPIDQFIAALGKLGLTGEEIADIAWLTIEIQKYEQFPSSPEEPREASKPETEKSLPDSTDFHEITDSPTDSPTHTSTSLRPETSVQVEVHAEQQDNEMASSSRDLAIRIPDARSLQEPLTLARALRPLFRRVPSANMVLDEDATIRSIAEEQLWTLVLKPDLEPWLELALVVDESKSMLLWQRTIRELQRLLERYGIFRDVRTWGMVVDEVVERTIGTDGRVQEHVRERIRIRPGIGKAAQNQRTHSPAELIDPQGRRLVLIATDCVASHWHDGQVLSALRTWSQSSSTAIIQMLPEWLWSRTALELAAPVRFRALLPGLPSQRLQAKPLSSWDEIDFETGIQVPIITLEPEVFTTWSKLVAGKGGVWAPGFVFEPELFELEEDSSDDDLSAEQRVRKFYNSASPAAQKLARLLAAAPVIYLPVVRIVQKEFFPKPKQVHVAEVFLGGLLKTSQPLSEITPDTDPDGIRYVFVNGVREILLESSLRSDSIDVLKVVSQFIDSRLGKSLEEFVAYLKDPNHIKDEEFQSHPIALVTAQILRQLGGEYARYADDIDILDEQSTSSIGQVEQHPKEVSPSTTSNLYALLIGIDYYMPNHLPNGSSYKNLGGCVRDVNGVEALLKERWQVPDSNILKLTASINPVDPNQPAEPPMLLPTRQNIIDCFRELGEIAPSGSQVYIHYSGYGGRARTIFPEIKEADGIDEGLVPTDIGASEGQYLRDLELAQLLKELVDKGLVVTLVLDCCYSGGATRGNAAIRGMDIIDDKAISDNFVPIASLSALGANWQFLNSEGGLPESRDYVLLAACRKNEFAFEYAFNRETGERNGALTYWLLDTLRQQSFGQTYKDLHDRIRAKVHSQFPNQTPILIGEGDRMVFGRKDPELTFYIVPVLRVEQNPNIGELRVVLGVGQQNFVDRGAEFAIYSRGTTDFANKGNRIAIARIIERGSTESICKLEPITGHTVEPGDQAVQISVSINLVRQVSLFAQEEATAEDLAQFVLPAGKLKPEIFAHQADAFEAIRAAIAGNGWFELTTDVGGVDFFIVVNNNGEYEIRDRVGVPLPNITPALSVRDMNSSTRLVNRLVHLAKYQSIAEIDNTDSLLFGKLSVEWLGTSDSYERGDPIPKKFKPFPDPSRPSGRVGEYIFLSIQNNSSQSLNVAAIGFEADWSISQILPASPSEMFITLEPNRRQIIPLQISIESQSSTVENTVKVFATVGESNFRMLELPPLDEGIISKGYYRSGRFGSGSLDALLKAIDAEQTQTRRLTVEASPSLEWTTKQVSLTIVGSNLRPMAESFAHGYALLIGVGQSAYPALSLPITVKDVKALEAILVNPDVCGYPAANLQVLTDTQATRQAILDGLEWLRQRATTDTEATIVVYYSGHGWLDSSQNHYYLIPHDVKPFDLAESALAATEFTAALQQIPAERLLVIIDSSHAEGMVVKQAHEEALELPADLVAVAPSKGDLLIQQRGRVVLASCAGTQKSWARRDQTMSIFTHHLIEALQGAANHPGETMVKVSHVMNHLGKTVEASAMTEYQAAQAPQFDFNTEDFEIALLQGGKGLPTGGWEAVNQQTDESKVSTQIGERSVVISGDADGSTIITGDHNIVGNVNAIQHDNLLG